MSDFHSEYQDGFLLCEFSHAARFSVGAKEVDLSSSDLHVMVASGPGELSAVGASSLWWLSPYPVARR